MKRSCVKQFLFIVWWVGEIDRRAEQLNPVAAMDGAKMQPLRGCHTTAYNLPHEKSWGFYRFEGSALLCGWDERVNEVDYTRHLWPEAMFISVIRRHAEGMTLQSTETFNFQLSTFNPS